jgi:hypothetical protein
VWGYTVHMPKLEKIDGARDAIDKKEEEYLEELNKRDSLKRFADKAMKGNDTINVPHIEHIDKKGKHVPLNEEGLKKLISDTHKKSHN